MRSVCWSVALAFAAPGLAWGQSSTPDGEFIYHARARDTLIGISRRLLIEPRRWPEVQARNHIADPRRIPLGDEVRIPYAWLRMSPDAATVAAIRGDVRQGANHLAPGQTLAEGSEIQTGPDGSVTLELADGSAITLQKSSDLRLEEMRRVTGVPGAHDTRLELQSGRSQTVVKPQGDVGRFEIVTPVAVSAVRGTQFRDWFEPGAGNANTETLAGLVAVSGSNATVPVPANFGTRVERNSAPMQPRPLLPPPDLQALPATNGGSQLHLQWPAVPGATGYRVQLAPDAEFRAFLVDAEFATPQVDLPAPADGSYWLRARSIDDIGLEGRDAVKTLVQHQLPPAPTLATPLPGTDVIGAGAAFTWRGLGPGIRQRLQIARDANFTNLFLERDAGEATHAEVEQVPPGHYFWRVAGVNDKGEAGEWSPAQEYIQRQVAPTPSAPTFVGREMQLHWEPQAGVRYRIQVARDPEFKAPLLERTLDTPGLSMRRPRMGVYYARVQTIAEDGSTGPFGESRKFEVPVPLWLKITLPLLPLLFLV